MAKLADGIGDPAPDGRAVVIILGGELVGACGALIKRLLSVALEHQVSRAPRSGDCCGTYRISACVGRRARKQRQMELFNGLARADRAGIALTAGRETMGRRK